MRRKFLQQMGAMASVLAAPRVFAQSAPFPSKQIRIVLGFAAGGSSDAIIRFMTPKFAELLGQPVIVENKPGAATVVACNYVRQSPADGHTLLFTGGGGHSIHTIDQPQIPYDPIKDFTAIATTSLADWTFAVHPSIPAKNLGEYVAYAKANPGKISFGSQGVGRINHLAMERFNIGAGIQAVHVPYKDSGNALTDLATGRIHAYFTTSAVLNPFIDDGKFRAIARTSADTSTVPAPLRFASVGQPELDSTGSVEILLGPKDMPAPVVALWGSTIQKVLAMPDIQTSFKAQKEVAYFRDSAQTLERLKSDQDRYTKVIRTLNIKMGANA